MAKSQLEENYKIHIRPALQKELSKKNLMEVPQISKIVLNVGAKDAVNDSRILDKIMAVVERIASQRPIKRAARKSIAGFKLREGMLIGVMVTLRDYAMYEFLYKLIHLALPNMKDFQGISVQFDGRGNYNLGIKDWTIFPEIRSSADELSYGCNITIHTTAETDKEGFALLKKLGMPFKEQL